MNQKVIIITGASRGIGRSIAVKLSADSIKLVLVGRDAKALMESSKLCEKKGAKTLEVLADITSEKDVSAIFAKTLKTFGTPDVLINNAGMGIFKHIADTNTDEWHRVINTNLTGTFLCTREAMRLMINSGGGIIINIASVVGIKGYPNQGAYTASKHGIVGLTKVIAEEGKEHNIKAHVICPGGVATDMVKEARPDINHDELIQPEDVAELTAYLLSMPPNVTVDLVHLRRFTSSSF